MPKTCASVISLTTLGKCNICFGLQNQLFLTLGGMKQGNPTYTEHCTTLFQHTVLYSPNIRLGAKNSKSIKHGVLEKSSKVTNPPNCL